MNELFSLRTLIDDILLLVRNNNISESEDLSRAQIAAWILAYKQAIIKARRDAEDTDGEDDDDTSLGELVQSRGPLELQEEESLDNTPLFRKRTVEPIDGILDKDPRNLFCVYDQDGEIIQIMSQQRKFYHRFRKYTGGELTCWYENVKEGDEAAKGYIYVTGRNDLGRLKYIWIDALFEDGDDSENADEDDVKIPGWMIPDIKKNIFANELAFMLQRISDDDNNSTLDGIKPQAPAVTPNEK